MKNIERMREMDTEELAQLINNRCKICIYYNQSCLHDRCNEGIVKWLNQEAELTIDDIYNEHTKLCCSDSILTYPCISCKYKNKTCEYEFIVDNFNINNGKITRREK